MSNFTPMKKVLHIGSFIFLLVFSTQQVYSQTNAEGCGSARYLLPSFDSVEVQTVQYGQNRTVLGNIQRLFVDVYQPVDDFQSTRPLMIWVYGGAFVAGSRKDMVNYCRVSAHLGYVSAAIDYRLFPLILGIPDSLQALDATVKAVGDLKAAIRYFREDAAIDNQFRIDTNFVFVGGISAGAITALHSAYLDENDDMSSHLSDILIANGGLDGSSSTNFQYNSKIQAVISLSGALHRAEWLDAGDAPVCSYHAKDDAVVPFGKGIANVLGNDIVYLEGSDEVHKEADREGVPNYFKPMEMGGHGEIYSSPQYEEDRIEFSINSYRLLYDILCEGLTSIEENHATRFYRSFPNPATDQIKIDGLDNLSKYSLSLYDLQGQHLLIREFFGDEFVALQDASLVSGIYLGILRNDQGRTIGQMKLSIVK